MTAQPEELIPEAKGLWQEIEVPVEGFDITPTPEGVRLVVLVTDGYDGWEVGEKRVAATEGKYGPKPHRVTVVDMLEDCAVLAYTAREAAPAENSGVVKYGMRPPGTKSAAQEAAAPAPAPQSAPTGGAVSAEAAEAMRRAREDVQRARGAPAEEDQPF